jgi:hypothetical protein
MIFVNYGYQYINTIFSLLMKCKANVVILAASINWRLFKCYL